MADEVVHDEMVEVAVRLELKLAQTRSYIYAEAITTTSHLADSDDKLTRFPQHLIGEIPNLIITHHVDNVGVSDDWASI